jgi:hypothetical protein
MGISRGAEQRIPARRHYVGFAASVAVDNRATAIRFLSALASPPAVPFVLLNGS